MKPFVICLFFIIGVICNAFSSYADILDAESIVDCPCTATQSCNACDCNHPRCNLSYDNSYLKLAVQNGNTDSVWNKVSFELMDMAEIAEQMIANGVNSITIKNRIYILNDIIEDGINRISIIRNMLLTPGFDEIRNKNMYGLSYILPTFEQGLCQNLSGKKHYYAFHTASIAEGILKFLKIVGKKRTLFIQDTLGDLDIVLKNFFDDWNTNIPFHGGAYEDVVETMYTACANINRPAIGLIAYNMAASIGAAYILMADFGKDSEYLRRAIKLVAFTEDAIDSSGNWYYSQYRDRFEDPDHASEVLRFMKIMRDRSLFSNTPFTQYLVYWFVNGVKYPYLNKTLQLGVYVQGELIAPVYLNRMVGIFKQQVYLSRELWN